MCTLCMKSKEEAAFLSGSMENRGMEPDSVRTEEVGLSPNIILFPFLIAEILQQL